MIIKDTELFLEGSWRHSVREEIINKFLDRYQEIYKEITLFCEKNKLEIDSEKKITKESLNSIYENNLIQDSVKIYSFEEMKNFMMILVDE